MLYTFGRMYRKTRTAPRKTRSESRNQFLKASRQQIRPHHSSRLSAVCMIWCETVPHQIMLSGFLCLLVIWFTYKSAFRMLVEMSLAQSPVFLWSNFSHHSIGQWTLSCSKIPTLFKLQSLVVLKPSDSKLWDHPDGIWENFDAALFLVFWKILIPSEWNLHVMLGEVNIFWRPMQFQMTFDN